MNYYEILGAKAESVEVEPSSTSYFSEPGAGLDPRLFRDSKLVSDVRQSILGILLRHLSIRYQNAEVWAHVWLAGSGVSKQWTAQRTPADLDCLIGINYIKFRESNTNYAGYSDAEIAATLNEGFRLDLHPETEDFMGSFELTFYVNVRSNILDIKPYAAYSVTNDSWTVAPTNEGAPMDASWAAAASQDVLNTQNIINKYGSALDKIKNAQTDVTRVNAERELAAATEQGAAFFDVIHEGRGEAFSPTGAGYSDFSNYRWQAGKQSGIINALKKLKNLHKDAKATFAVETYGVELPDTSTLIRRAQAVKYPS